MLLVEECDLQSITNEVLEESKGGPKKYMIKGPFIEANRENKNKRVYPGPIVAPQVEAYQTKINENRAVGELEHPSTLEINPKNISHKTTKLAWDGKNIVLGEAEICTTPNGMIVRSLMDSGIKMAVSSRGSGTLKEGVVQKDYKYICNDIVWDPSAPSAFVENILEAQTEWIIENGILLEQEVEDLQEKLKHFRGKDINKVLVSILDEALTKATKKTPIKV